MSQLPFALTDRSRRHLRWLALALGALLIVGQGSMAQAGCPALLNATQARLQDEAPVNLCQFAGKTLLVVNTASYCGFTDQYKELEALYQQYKDKGLVVLGFPSNDFSQEPGSNQAVAEFCTNTYSVKFPMFAKSHVKGPQANPLFKQLSRQSESPGWNFHKYLIGPDGRLVRSYASVVSPLSRTVRSDIEALLNKPSKPASTKG
jgi:glutathione peroxidase